MLFNLLLKMIPSNPLKFIRIPDNSILDRLHLLHIINTTEKSFKSHKIECLTWYVRLLPPPVGIKTNTSFPLIVAFITSRWLGRKEWFPNTFLLLAWQWKICSNAIPETSHTYAHLNTHLKLLCPREISATPLLVIWTINIVNFKILWDVWFSFHWGCWKTISTSHVKWKWWWIPVVKVTGLIVSTKLCVESCRINPWREWRRCGILKGRRCFILKGRN